MSEIEFRDEKDPAEALDSCKQDLLVVSAATIALCLAWLFPSFGDGSEQHSEELEAVMI